MKPVIRNLLVQDVLLPDAHLLSGDDEGLVLSLKSPKTRRVWRAQFVLVRNPALISWMRWWLEGKPRHQRLFRFGRRAWAKLVAEGLESLGLGDRGYTLSSFRQGGATWMFKQTMNLAQLQYHGRWSRQETLKSYLQEAFSVQVAASASISARERLNFVNRDWSLLSTPPPLARIEFLR